MTENNIIESKRNSIITIISIVIILISLCITVPNIQQIAKINAYSAHTKEYIQSLENFQDVTGGNKYNDSISNQYYNISEYRNKKALYIAITIICIIVSICALITILLSAKTTLVVTDKRVYGTVALGKRVDIPIKSISSIGTGLLQSIIVASSSGKICFYGISNYKEIHTEISNLILSEK